MGATLVKQLNSLDVGACEIVAAALAVDSLHLGQQPWPLGNHSPQQGEPPHEDDGLGVEIVTMRACRESEVRGFLRGAGGDSLFDGSRQT